MEENDVQSRKRAQSRQRRKTLLLRLDQDRLACRSFSRRSGFPRIRRPGYDVYLCAQAVTSEPTFSPETTRRILPGWFRLKMIIGRLLSLHKLTAVVSITFNPSRRISM